MDYYINYMCRGSYDFGQESVKPFYALSNMGKMAVIISGKTLVPGLMNYYADIDTIIYDKDGIEKIFQNNYNAYEAELIAEYQYGGK